MSSQSWEGGGEKARLTHPLKKKEMAVVAHESKTVVLFTAIRGLHVYNIVPEENEQMLIAIDFSKNVTS